MFLDTKAWLGCPFVCSYQCIQVSPIHLLGAGLTNSGLKLLNLEDNSTSKAECQY